MNADTQQWDILFAILIWTFFFFLLSVNRGRLPVDEILLIYYFLLRLLHAFSIVSVFVSTFILNSQFRICCECIFIANFIYNFHKNPLNEQRATDLLYHFLCTLVHRHFFVVMIAFQHTTYYHSLPFDSKSFLHSEWTQSTRKN